MEKLESGNAVLQTIHASEGGRALKLLQQRQKRQQELESAKTQIESETKKRRFFGIDSKYKGSTTEALEEAFKKETVGLVSAEEFREKRKRLNELIEEREKKEHTVPEKRQKASRLQRRTLSFLDEEDASDGFTDQKPGIQQSHVSAPYEAISEAPQEGQREDEYKKLDDEGETEKYETEAIEGPKEGFKGQIDDLVNEGNSKSSVNVLAKSEKLLIRRRNLGKDPTVYTEFLQDSHRDAQRALEREILTQEYYIEEDKVKSEILEVTYSYWDGSGHRRVVRVPKGSSMLEFLKVCHAALEKEFTELRGVPPENLMYIKEDLILPHNMTFYTLIKTKARGKSGPLFHFDVHDDIRLLNDARVEKDESHAGKIVDRKWYERNKHIFPASRWQVYDAAKTFEKYTIHGHDDFSQVIR